MMLAEQMRSPEETKRKILPRIFQENPDQNLRIPSISLEDTWSELSDLERIICKGRTNSTKNTENYKKNQKSTSAEKVVTS